MNKAIRLVAVALCLLLTISAAGCAGSTPDEALGLIETVDKAAQFYMMTAHLPVLQKINDSQLKEMAAVLGITPRPGYID